VDDFFERVSIFPIWMGDFGDRLDAFLGWVDDFFERVSIFPIWMDDFGNRLN
jgi:hypothetical protein